MIVHLSRRHLIAIGLGAAMAPAFSRRAAAEGATIKTNTMAEFGEPFYQPNFDHWLYANPNAPKGGRTILADEYRDSFDSLNPYILQGEWPSSIGLIYDNLMNGSDDELSSAYPLLAESTEYPEDKSWLIFNMRT